MIRRRLLSLSLTVVFAAASSAAATAQGLSFRQDNTALPQFGGYVPGSGAILTGGTGRHVTFRQGSAATALPAFGGYVPGSGAVLRAAPRMRTTFRQGGANVALPAFGGFVPGAGARVGFGNRAPAVPAPIAAAMANRARGVAGGPLGQRGQAVAARAAIQQAAAARRAPQPPVAAPQSAQRADRNDLRRAMRRQRAAEQLLKKGQVAESKGNWKLAEKYYRLGLKRDASEVNEAIRTRLRKITDRSSPAP